MARAVLITFLLFITYVSCSANNRDRPLVRSPLGQVRGVIRQTRNGREVEAFFGIPYAEPPVGQLRFRSPVPKRSWSGVLEAVNETAKCPQKGESASVNEDCLYLNVYKPRNVSARRRLPVMVFIHGGSFVQGSNAHQDYGPDYLLDRDVILVVPNYRLGIFGFLSTGDEVAPGNFGMKDQTEALRWVKRNIRSFGGDPNKVTLFGESSGSACVHFHVLSDSSDGLFHRYILQSGTALTPWAFRNNATYSTYPKKIAEKYNCPVTSSQQTISCLRNLNVEQLLDVDFLFDNVSIFTEITWGPTTEPDVDDAFLTDHPVNIFLTEDPKDIPFIAGDVKDESLLFGAVLNTTDSLYQSIISNVEGFLLQLFSGFLSPSESTRVARAVMQFYFGGDVLNNKNTALRQFVDFNSDMFYLYPQVAMFRHMKKTLDCPSYFYILEYRGSFSLTSLVLGNNENIGVSHADDLLYLFPFIADRNMTQTDNQVSNSMLDLWTTFAATGVPRANNVPNPNVWRPYSLPNNHLRIGNNADPSLKMERTLHQDRMDFWDRTLPYRAS